MHTFFHYKTGILNNQAPFEKAVAHNGKETKVWVGHRLSGQVKSLVTTCQGLVPSALGLGKAWPETEANWQLPSTVNC